MGGHEKARVEKEMAQPLTTSRRLGWSGLVVVALAAGIAGFFPELMRYSTGPTTILTIFAREAFDWSSSTTPAPLSTTAVLVKSILRGKSSALALGLEDKVLSVSEPDGKQSVLDVPVSPVRDLIAARVLREVQQLCGSKHGDGGGSSCDPNEVDSEFGTTPLHLAELWGSRELVEYLLSIGADTEAFDTVGRQPRNMTFKAFSVNSKRAADARLPSPGAASLSAAELRDRRCEIPEVVIPLFPAAASAEKPSAAAGLQEQWLDSARAALAEVRRLVSEGEPVMVRNAIHWLQKQHDMPLRFPDAASFAEAWGHRPVDVGEVPYAKNFDLRTELTTLSDYIESTAGSIVVIGGGEKDAAAGHPQLPNYVFQVDTEACLEGRELLGKIVEAALPSAGDNPIVCPPPIGLRGLESVHYYLGGRWSGAPFHIHSDALNLAVSGKKKWWVVTPRSAVWSKRHILEYAEDGKGGPADGDDRPMECVQHGGDLVYVPGDWGHAAMNLEDGTFGYTLELVNRRDTLASVLGMGCEK